MGHRERPLRPIKSTGDDDVKLKPVSEATKAFENDEPPRPDILSARIDELEMRGEIDQVLGMMDIVYVSELVTAYKEGLIPANISRDVKRALEWFSLL